MTTSPSESSGSRGETEAGDATAEPEGHFRPTGTIAILAAFVLTLILLWLSVYVILLSRGVTA